jgi:hypothetical protein
MSSLSPLQREALKKPCKLCGNPLIVIGDLGDFDHDIVQCSDDDNCEYTLMYDGYEFPD